MTKYLIGERCSGKTTRLILRSAEEQLYILTSTKHRAQAIFDNARNMGLDIPFPVTLDEYLRGNKFQGSSIRRDGILIDDLDDVIRTLFSSIPIHEVTLTDHGNVERLDSLIKKDNVVDIYRKMDEIRNKQEEAGLNVYVTGVLCSDRYTIGRIEGILYATCVVPNLDNGSNLYWINGCGKSIINAICTKDQYLSFRKIVEERFPGACEFEDVEKD